MDIENNFIKPVLLFHFSKGKSEIEAHSEISRQYGKYAISLKTVKKWFGIFSKEYNYSINSGSTISLQELPDELLSNFINGNNDRSKSYLKELEEARNCSKLTLSTRKSNTNNGDNKVNNSKRGPKKSASKFTDEFIINLVNENPTLNMEELAKLANTSQGTISRKLKEINSNGERVKYSRKKAKDEKTKRTPGMPLKFTDDYLIDLINENPNLKMYELAQLAKTSTTTICNRLKQINSEGVRVSYNKENHKSRAKFSHDLIINLISENPDINNKELAKLANCSQSTISRKLKQINAEGERSQYPINDQRTVKKLSDDYLIDLIKNNPALNTGELAKLANTSRATISNRLKKLEFEGLETANYLMKNSQNYRSKLSDEFLIKLVNENPRSNMEELAKLSQTSRITISRRLKEINSEGIRVNYIDKKFKNDQFPKTIHKLFKFTDEYLINLINNNPSLNLQELGKLANTSARTISNRIKRINKDEIVINYISKRTTKL